MSERDNRPPAPVQLVMGRISEDTVRRVLNLLEVYATGEFTLEMAAAITSAALEGHAALSSPMEGGE